MKLKPRTERRAKVSILRLNTVFIATFLYIGLNMKALLGAKAIMASSVSCSFHLVVESSAFSIYSRIMTYEVRSTPLEEMIGRT